MKRKADFSVERAQELLEMHGHGRCEYIDTLTASELGLDAKKLNPDKRLAVFKNEDGKTFIMDESYIKSKIEWTMNHSTWRVKIAKEMGRYGESFSDVISSTLTEEDLDVEFEDGYGSPKGKPFTIWTKNRVYFPTDYDGLEGVKSVSRNPDGKPTDHIGGPW